MSDLVQLLAEFHDDPEGFWRGVLRGEPRLWQARVCEEIRLRLAAGERHVRVLCRTAHGSGKTTLAAALGIFWTATRPLSRGITTAPTWQAVEGVLWKEVARIFGGSLLASAGVGTLLQTSLTFGVAWDLEGLSTDHAVNLEGRHGAAAVRIVDEAKAIEPAVIESTEALLDAPETLDIWISTPSIPSGAFFDRDVKGGPDVIRAVVTIDDLVDEGLEGKREWRAARLLEWGANSPEYESRCLANYISDAEGALYPFSWISRAEDAAFDVPLVPVAGLDVGGSIAGDASACAILCGPDDLGRFRLRSVESWHEKESAATQGRALYIARTAGAKVLAVDTQGVGFGVAGGMKSEKDIGIASFRASSSSSEPDRFVNLKAEVAWTLRLALEAGAIRLPKHDGLRRELLAMKYQVTSAGKIKVVDPSDSPDLVDAVLVALSVAAGGPPVSMDDVSFGASDYGDVADDRPGWGSPASGTARRSAWD